MIQCHCASCEAGQPHNPNDRGHQVSYVKDIRVDGLLVVCAGCGHRQVIANELISIDRNKIA